MIGIHTSASRWAFVKRIMPRSTENIMRITGLGACVVSGVVLIAWASLIGPKFVAHSGMLIGKLAVLAAKGIAGAPAEHTAFWLFLLLHVLSTLIFAACFWIRTSPSIRRSAGIDAGLLLVQILIGLTCNADFLIIVQVELAFVLPWREATIWFGAQTVAYMVSRVPFVIAADSLVIVCNAAGISYPSAMIDQALGIAWSIAWGLFAFCGGYVAVAEQRSRHQLAAAHAELVATQQLLADAVSASERVRIARDLHDAIGHHLTALNLHLDLAVRQSGKQVIAALQSARELAHRLLAEVRTVVSIERKDQTINLP